MSHVNRKGKNLFPFQKNEFFYRMSKEKDITEAEKKKMAEKKMARSGKMAA